VNEEEVIVVFMVISMLATFLVSWKWSNSIRTGFILALIMGKTWAGIAWAFGIDRPLFQFIIYNKIKNTASTITITADQFIFLSFFFTLIFTLLWPYIAPHIPEPIRNMNLIGEEK